VVSLAVKMAAPKSEILMSWPPGGQQDVGRLDVPVGDALQVGVVEGPGALEDDFDQALEGQQVVWLGEGLQGAAGTYSMTT
jgi:hypothetical protein